MLLVSSKAWWFSGRCSSLFRDFFFVCWWVPCAWFHRPQGRCWLSEVGGLLGGGLPVQGCHMAPDPAAHPQASHSPSLETGPLLPTAWFNWRVCCSSYRNSPTSPRSSPQTLLPLDQLPPSLEGLHGHCLLLHETFLEFWFLFFQSFHICLLSFKESA